MRIFEKRVWLNSASEGEYVDGKETENWGWLK